MKRTDIALIVVIIILAGAYYVFFGRHTTGDEVLITLDGEEYGTYPLAENQGILVESPDGYNLVCILDGEVFVADADCRDKYCMRQGKTSEPQKCLICLPHKLVVEVRSDRRGGESDIDMVAQ